MTSGLVNLGNTCYINSVLQCLVNNKRFLVNLIKEHENIQKPPNTKYYDFLDCFVVLAKEMYLNENILRPSTFKKVLVYNKPHYNNKLQHDSEELFLDILDMIYEITSKDTNKEKKTGLLFSSKKQWESYFKYDSFILDEYYGQYMCKYTCNGCDESFYDFVPFCSIYLDLPLYDTDTFTLLKNHFKKDYKNVNCKNYCNRGKDPDDLLTPEHLIENKIFKLPNTLVIVLKRYTKNRTKSKINVHIEERLDLSDYYPINYNTTEETVYKIKSVINNYGDTIMSGHYTTTKVEDKKMIEYDDTKKTPVLDLNLKDCYILFYER